MEQQFIEINTFGPATSMDYKSKDLSTNIADDDVIVDVNFSGINFADVIMRLGLYQDAPPRPFTPGYELSGTVSQIGSKVTRFKVGDKVMAGTQFGGYVNKITLPEWQVLHLPQGFTLEEGAATPVNYITAYIALHEFARVRAGDKVLVDCATGGVGVFMLQMCKKVGAQAVGLTTTAAKKEFIESYGGRAYTWDEFEANPENEFDFILNSSGGKTLKKHYKLLAKSGLLCCIGMQSMVKNGKSSKIAFLKAVLSVPWYPMVKLIMDSRAVCGFNALKYFDNADWMKKHLPSMEETDIHPFVGGVFPAKEVANAHEFLEQKKAKGKVLIQWQ